MTSHQHAPQSKNRTCFPKKFLCISLFLKLSKGYIFFVKLDTQNIFYFSSILCTHCIFWSGFMDFCVYFECPTSLNDAVNMAMMAAMQNTPPPSCRKIPPLHPEWAIMEVGNSPPIKRDCVPQIPRHVLLGRKCFKFSPL